MDYQMDNYQLLAQIEQNTRKQVKLARMQCIFTAITLLCSVAMIILVICFIPRLTTLIEQVEVYMAQAEIIMTNLETVSEELANMEFGTMMDNLESIIANIESLISNVDELVATAKSGVEETLGNLGKIDFEKLKQPLSKFFNILK